jgi:hypothetical protein
VGIVGEIKWSKRKSARPLVSIIQRKAAEAKLKLITDQLWVVAARQELTDIYLKEL